MVQRIITIIFGLFWLMLGSVYFFDLNFASDFFSAFEASTYEKLSGKISGTSYLAPIIHAIQLVAGLCLIFGRFSALALIVLAPITFNILLYDFYVKPEELVIGITLTVLHITLLVMHHRTLAPLLHWDN